MILLELLLAVDGFVQTVEYLVIYQIISVVSGRETVIYMKFMLRYATLKVSGNAGVKGGMACVCQYVYYALGCHGAFGDRGSKPAMRER